MNTMYKIGDRVKKISNKPFKSGKQINTIKGFTINQHTGKDSFTLLEDESNVEIFRCEMVI